MVAGAALPDLVDKPLAMLGVIPAYHSVAHSALVSLRAAVALLLVRRRGDPSGVGRVAAVALGGGSHLLADAVHIITNGRPEDTVFLLWPVISEWDWIDAAPGTFAVQYVGTPSCYVELVIWAAVGALLARDGLPTPQADS